MTLTELAYELNAELKDSDSELTNKLCFDEIRKKISGASQLTNLQLLLLASVVSSKNEFQERIFIEFLDNSN